MAIAAGDEWAWILLLMHLGIWLDSSVVGLLTCQWRFSGTLFEDLQGEPIPVAPSGWDNPVDGFECRLNSAATECELDCGAEGSVNQGKDVKDFLFIFYLIEYTFNLINILGK